MTRPHLQPVPALAPERSRDSCLERVRAVLDQASPRVAAILVSRLELVVAEAPLLEATLRAPEPARDPAPSRLLTADEAAALLNIPVRWIRRHAKTIPHRRVGKYVRFEARALLRWAETRSRS